MLQDPVIVGVLGTLGLFALIALGMPIAFAMMLTGFVGLSLLSSLEAALPVASGTLWQVASFYPYTVIPLFIVMGGFAGSSGITTELYSSFEKWSRRLPGGLAIATIGACGAFSALCGSSVATAATMGAAALPEMERFKYDPKLAAGSVAAGGTLGFLIPPSIGFIIYGMLTEQSIGKLLVAGILPGILLVAAYMGIVVIWAVSRPQDAPTNAEPVSWSQRLAALKGVREPVIIFLFVMGGIYAGLFTPTEAGAIGATVLLAVTIIRRKLTASALFQALIEAIRISAMVLTLVAGANVFSYFMALSTIPMKVAGWAGALAVSPYAVLAIILLIFLILGCFLDAISMMVLTLPVIFPVIIALKFDPIWFGVIAVLMMEAGLITPPMGLNIFTVAGTTKNISVEDIFKGVAPFLIAILAVAVILTIFPGIALYLPDMMTR